MNLKLLTLIVSTAFFLSACSSSPPLPTATNPQANLPLLEGNQPLGDINLSDTTKWSRFSFPHFSIDLPINWQVTSINSDYSQIKIATIPGTFSETSNFEIIISKSNQIPNSWNTTISEFQAYKQVDDHNTTFIVATPKPEEQLSISFFGANSHPNFINTAISTLHIKP